MTKTMPVTMEQNTNRRNLPGVRVLATLLGVGALVCSGLFAALPASAATVPFDLGELAQASPTLPPGLTYTAPVLAVDTTQITDLTLSGTAPTNTRIQASADNPLALTLDSAALPGAGCSGGPGITLNAVTTLNLVGTNTVGGTTCTLSAIRAWAALTISGPGSLTATSQNSAINVDAGAAAVPLVITGGAQVTANAPGGDSEAMAIRVRGSLSIEGTSGVTATANGAFMTNLGVRLEGAAPVLSVSDHSALTATGSGGFVSNQGVSLQNAGTVSVTENSALIATATGSGAIGVMIGGSASARGSVIVNDSSLLASGATAAIQAAYGNLLAVGPISVLELSGPVSLTNGTWFVAIPADQVNHGSQLTISGQAGNRIDLEVNPPPTTEPITVTALTDNLGAPFNILEHPTPVLQGDPTTGGELYFNTNLNTLYPGITFSFGLPGFTSQPSAFTQTEAMTPGFEVEFTRAAPAGEPALTTTDPVVGEPVCVDWSAFEPPILASGWTPSVVWQRVGGGSIPGTVSDSSLAAGLGDCFTPSSGAVGIGIEAVVTITNDANPEDFLTFPPLATNPVAPAVVPSPTGTPTVTPTATATPTPTGTASPTPTGTPTSSPTPTGTPTPTPSPTATRPPGGGHPTTGSTAILALAGLAVASGGILLALTGHRARAAKQ